MTVSTEKLVAKMQVAKLVASKRPVTKVRLPNWLTGKCKFPKVAKRLSAKAGTQAGTHPIGNIGNICNVNRRDQNVSSHAALVKSRVQNRGCL